MWVHACNLSTRCWQEVVNEASLGYIASSCLHKKRRSRGRETWVIKICLSVCCFSLVCACGGCISSSLQGYEHTGKPLTTNLYVQIFSLFILKQVTTFPSLELTLLTRMTLNMLSSCLSIRNSWVDSPMPMGLASFCLCFKKALQITGILDANRKIV